MTPKQFDDNPLVRAFYAQRATLRNPEHIAKWFEEHLHLLPNIPEHRPNQRIVSYEQKAWLFTRAVDVCHKATAELTVKILSPITGDDEDLVYTLFSYQQILELDFADWPYLTASAIACHVVANDAHDEPSYLPIIDGTIAQYQPLHFPDTSLKALHALKDNELLCIEIDARGKHDEVINLLFDSHPEKGHTALPECLF